MFFRIKSRVLHHHASILVCLLKAAPNLLWYANMWLLGTQKSACTEMAPVILSLS